MCETEMTQIIEHSVNSVIFMIFNFRLSEPLQKRMDNFFNQFRVASAADFSVLVLVATSLR